MQLVNPRYVPSEPGYLSVRGSTYLNPGRCVFSFSCSCAAQSYTSRDRPWLGVRFVLRRKHETR